MTTSRERLQAALAHRAPDRIPVDFGSTPVTGIHVRMVEALRRELDLRRAVAPLRPAPQRLDPRPHRLEGVQALLRRRLPPHPQPDRRGLRHPEPGADQRRGHGPVRLKREFGGQPTFWGGCVDTQKVLPFATPAEVEAHVLRQCETLGRDGGFVFTTVHNVQANVPVEDVLAMLRALRRANRS